MTNDIVVDILNELKICDQHFTHKVGIDKMFDSLSVYDSQTFTRFCPESGIVRHQFILFIFKLIQKRFKASEGIVKNYEEFFKNYKELFLKYDP